MNIRTSLIAFVLVLASCAVFQAFSGSVQTSEVAPGVQFLVARHDAYVTADPALDQATRDIDLAESAALTAVLALPEVDGPTFSVRLTPVAARHDAYVESDGTLSSLERRVYLRTTSELRAVVLAAQAAP